MDSKASLLVAFDGVALAGLWSAGKDVGLSGLPLAVAVVAGSLFLASIVALLLAVLPRLGDGQSGFLLWASMSPEEVEAELLTESSGAHVVALSKIVNSKMGVYRLAVFLALAGLAAAVLAAAVQVAVQFL
ncbi:Pycsar system effector family protein [Streptomyces sp. cg28]|uniref:Pycsar system effector family protein n=1 Tax=Streptomyces sp. cg28 TaxID=3403457 RepID=UPI003B216859